MKWLVCLFLSCSLLLSSMQNVTAQEEAKTSLTAFSYSGNPCPDSDLTEPLELAHAVQIALCNQPQTRQVWASVALQNAQVALAKTAYLPNLDVVGVRNKGNFGSSVSNYPELDYQLHAISHDVAVNLSWTLFDFGARHAKLESANQSLLAANATQDATLQNVFANTAEAYFALQSAEGALLANQQAEHIAQESLDAAQAKYQAGVGALADKLQAQTQAVQARLNRIKSQNDATTAHGNLAQAMGLAANTPFVLAAKSNAALPSNTLLQSLQSIKQLIQTAQQQHPTLLSANAQVAAAQADIDAAKAEGLPALSLVGNLDRNKQPGQYADTTSNTSTIGVQLKIPIMDSVAHYYRVQQAKAKWQGKQADLANAQQQVALDVWKNYAALTSETENISNAQTLVESAEQSFNVARGRYQSGVGNIIELLNAQTTLANAKQQQNTFLANWHSARIKLAASLGQLGMWAVR